MRRCFPAFLTVLLAATLLAAGCSTEPRDELGRAAERRRSEMPVPRPPAGRPLAGRKVFLVIPKLHFQDDEFRIVREYLSSAGATVFVVISAGSVAVGMRGTRVFPDLRITNVPLDYDFDALVFIGGPGAVEFYHDPVAHRLARRAYAGGMVVGAICLAPVTLARAGILKGRSVCCHKSARVEIEKLKVRWAGEGIQTDRRIVTAGDPKQSGAFAKALAHAIARRERDLQKEAEEEAERVRLEQEREFRRRLKEAKRDAERAGTR